MIRVCLQAPAVGVTSAGVKWSSGDSPRTAPAEVAGELGRGCGELHQLLQIKPDVDTAPALAAHRGGTDCRKRSACWKSAWGCDTTTPTAAVRAAVWIALRQRLRRSHWHPQRRTSGGFEDPVPVIRERILPLVVIRGL